jgi:ABC-type dipeptide/oligopeptide/nickel transport system ATPase component
MNRIDSLQINNFKFFQNEEPIQLNGNHLLLYGENGSGKSSVYWALYTLFEASLKTEDDQIRKYFSKVIKKEDCLVNIHAPATAPGADDYNSFIEVITDDETPKTFRISVSDVAIRGSTDAKFVNYASDFINYRMLLGLSSFRHSDKIDLFNLFVEDIFKYVQFARVQITRSDELKTFTNAFEIWQQIEEGLEWTTNRAEKRIRVYKNSPLYNELVVLINSFNESLQKLLDYINIHGPNYFKKLGYDFDFVLTLEKPASFTKGDTTYDVIPFVLRIKIPEYENVVDAIDKPHSFLNEAKLSAIAISIRLAVLSQKLKETGLKFIVLDDLLISLDMRNREKVLDILLSPEFSDNFQLLILTHDRMFYQMAKHKIDILEQESWQYIEMYETKGEDGISKPLIKSSKTYVEKAEEFFKSNNFPEAANNLRKAGEEFCKKILSKNQTISEDYSSFDLNGMIEYCLNFAKSNDLQHGYFNQLDKFRKFLLNAGSHDDYDTPLFKSEIADCLKIFKTYFGLVKIKHVLPVGTVLVFELIDGKTTEAYKFEITLRENLRIYKEPGKDLKMLKVKINYNLYKDGDLLTTQYAFVSLQKFYDKPYSTSDKKKDSDYLKEIIIEETKQPINSIFKI